MILKQLIAEGEIADPVNLFRITLHKIVTEFGIEKATVAVPRAAFAIARECKCFFQIEPGITADKDVLIFWSQSLGEDVPTVTDIQSAITGEQL